ncbi:hypothetical protein NEOKW01_1413 [Nematocida sp. AWRm80]|nr:hypothetical protein NEOKW01_1413 [Nematocida sp. AWRm80]
MNSKILIILSIYIVTIVLYQCKVDIVNTEDKVDIVNTEKKGKVDIVNTEDKVIEELSISMLSKEKKEALFNASEEVFANLYNKHLNEAFNLMNSRQPEDITDYIKKIEENNKLSLGNIEELQEPYKYLGYLVIVDDIYRTMYEFVAYITKSSVPETSIKQCFKEIFQQSNGSVNPKKKVQLSNTNKLTEIYRKTTLNISEKKGIFDIGHLQYYKYTQSENSKNRCNSEGVYNVLKKKCIYLKDIKEESISEIESRYKEYNSEKVPENKIEEYILVLWTKQVINPLCVLYKGLSEGKETFQKECNTMIENITKYYTEMATAKDLKYNEDILSLNNIGYQTNNLKDKSKPTGILWACTVLSDNGTSVILDTKKYKAKYNKQQKKANKKYFSKIRHHIDLIYKSIRTDIEKIVGEPENKQTETIISLNKTISIMHSATKCIEMLLFTICKDKIYLQASKEMYYSLLCMNEIFLHQNKDPEEVKNILKFIEIFKAEMKYINDSYSILRGAHKMTKNIETKDKLYTIKKAAMKKKIQNIFDYLLEIEKKFDTNPNTSTPNNKQPSSKINIEEDINSLLTGICIPLKEYNRYKKK